MSKWMEMYNRNTRPMLLELKNFWPEHILALFLKFDEHMLSVYGLGSKTPLYSAKYGWTLRFGHMSIYILNNILVLENGFVVDKIVVQDDATYEELITFVKKIYTEDFKGYYQNQVNKRYEDQKMRTKVRLEREKNEIRDMQNKIIVEKFNKFRWARKLSVPKLQQLYKFDAQGIKNEELVDEIGYTIYARCLQGKNEMELIQVNKMKCHNCGNILQGQRWLMECECGYQYLFREYMRSYRRNNMPHGSVKEKFAAFIKDWEKAQGYSDKMRLIDNLIHEFHVNLLTETKGRPVAINFIDGTKKQIEDLIFGLSGILEIRNYEVFTS